MRWWLACLFRSEWYQGIPASLFLASNRNKWRERSVSTHNCIGDSWRLSVTGAGSSFFVYVSGWWPGCWLRLLDVDVRTGQEAAPEVSAALRYVVCVCVCLSAAAALDRMRM